MTRVMKGGSDLFTSQVLASPRDRALTCEYLQRAGVEAAACDSFDDLLERLAEGRLGAAVLAEEMIPAGGVRSLLEVFARQPPWSDVPLVGVTSRRAPSLDWEPLLEVASLTLLERPVHKRTMIAAVRSGLRARRRQYQMRDLLVNLEEANRNLADQDRRKDEFLAMFGHELRNPLGTITNSLYVMRTTRSPEVLNRQRDAIDRQARRLGRLVDDLLDVSRVTMGKIVLQRERIDLREIAARCADEFGALAREQRQTVTLTAGAERLVVDGDPVRLEQVLSNLVTNAIKYTPEEGRIEVIVEREGDQAVLRVRDNGIGIEPPMLGRVFELFTQADRSLARARGGLGLGLPVVKHLVELHGGSVAVSSEGLGRGSEFTVRFPLAAPDSPAVVDRRPDREGKVSLRIVLVEDNSDARASLAEMLRLEGHEVDEAADGIQGAELIAATAPAVGLVDIGLPGWDGFEVARFVRERLGRQVKLIALTGYGQPQDRERALRAGFDTHLVKPVAPDELFRLLTRMARESPGGGDNRQGAE